MPKSNKEFNYIQYDDPKAALGVMCAIAKDSRIYARSQLSVFVENCEAAISYNQYVIQMFEGNAVGFLIYARVNKVIENIITSSIRQIYGPEWRCGNTLIIQDMVAVFGSGKELADYIVSKHPETEVKGVIVAKPTGNPNTPYHTANFHKGENPWAQ